MCSPSPVALVRYIKEKRATPLRLQEHRKAVTRGEIEKMRRS